MNYPPAAGGDASPEQIEALANEAWAQLDGIGAVAESLAQALDKAADTFRNVIVFIDKAKSLRGASNAEQLAAFEGLKAAVNEATASWNSISSEEVLGKLMLGLTAAKEQ